MATSVFEPAVNKIKGFFADLVKKGPKAMVMRIYQMRTSWLCDAREGGIQPVFVSVSSASHLNCSFDIHFAAIT